MDFINLDCNDITPSILSLNFVQCIMSKDAKLFFNYKVKLLNFDGVFKMLFDLLIFSDVLIPKCFIM